MHRNPSSLWRNIFCDPTTSPVFSAQAFHEPNKALAVFKIVGGCGALVLIGVWLYVAGRRRARMDPQTLSG